MSKVLSQAEIESLLADMTAPPPEESNASSKERGAATQQAPRPVHPVKEKVIVPLSKRAARAASGTAPRSFEIYDFRRTDKLSKDQLRTLQVLNETFARLLASSLSGYLRTQVQVELVSVEQIPYEEYVRSITNSIINVMSVSPLTGQMIYEIDLGILFVMIDRLLGGAGEGGHQPSKGLTDIEKVLATRMINRAMSDLTTAWENVAVVNFAMESMETSAQFVQIVPNNDTVVLTLFEVRLGDYQGAMSLCLPYLVLKPIINRLNAQHWFSSGTHKGSSDHAPEMAARLRQTTRIPCSARLGTARVSVGDLMHLEVGQILILQIPETSRSREEHSASQGATLGRADIVVGNQVKFRGRIGLRGGKRLAVQIDEVLPAPDTLIVHKEAA